MAITYVDIQDRYFLPPDDTEELQVTVIIGNGQTGGYVIFEDNKLKGANKAVTFKQAGKLVGKRCLVAATIVDTLVQTNWTSVTIEVVHGKNQHTYGPYSKEVPMHLDTVCYTIGIYFQTPQP